MKSWRAAVVAFAIAAPLAVSAIVAGCDQGSPASPTAPPIPSSDPLCPTPVDPTFDSVRTGLLQTDTCGAGRIACHSPSGAGGLNYQLSASDLYLALVGADGGGQRALNQNAATGAPPEYRVIPGDSDASALYVKLTLDVKNDPDFGAGMPFDHPGQLCSQDIGAVKMWIDNGAKFDEDAATPDAGDQDADEDASDATISDAGDASD
jgi:hypothetical protein